MNKVERKGNAPCAWEHTAIVIRPAGFITASPWLSMSRPHQQSADGKRRQCGHMIGSSGGAGLMERYDKAALNAAFVPEIRQNEGSLTSTLRTLLFFTALMITLPVGLYFSSKAYIFEGTLGMSNRDSYFYAAIVAVVTVHVVLAMFVYVAWSEGSRQWREGKQD
uniref:Vacuolar ATPase assembly factor VMA21 n=3 Tax=Phasianidae TaxID=9005 RepID=A0A8C2Y4T8_COTJA